MPLKPKSKKCGSKPASFDQNYTGDEETLVRIIRNNAKYFGVEPPADDDEAEQRIVDMFVDCIETQSYPTVEKLAGCLGIVRRELWEWEHLKTKGERRSNIIKKAKEKIAAMDAEAVSLGKLNTVAYIFRAKNYYGLTDNVTVEHKTAQPLGDTQDQSMLVGALLKQLQAQGQATIAQSSDYQPQPEQATIGEASDYAGDHQTTIAQEPSNYASDDQAETSSDYGTQTTFADMPSDYSAEDQATIPSDYSEPGDYQAEVQATISPLSALGKALAEELASKPAADVIDVTASEIIPGAEPDGAGS